MLANILKLGWRCSRGRRQTTCTHLTGSTPAYRFYVTDHQGNIRVVTDASGTILRTNHYDPYGEEVLPVLTSSSTLPASTAGTDATSRYMYGAKEWDADLSLYDFSARYYTPTGAASFTTMDPLCEKYYHISPYAYCAGDPVNLVDPSGCRIIGASRKDAELIVDDLRSMFQGEIFASFRSLIVQSGRHHNGKSLAKINPEALDSAISGIDLSEDQKALIEIVVKTINSKDNHIVEYSSGDGVASPSAEAAFLPGFLSGPLGPYMDGIIQANKGLPLSLLSNEGGGGVTTPTKTGTYTIVFDNGHENGRAVTTGHEVFGHGRSIALGLYEPGNPIDYQQHVNAIQTENLILRVMGLPFVNDGHNHGPRIIIPNAQDLPSFR